MNFLCVKSRERLYCNAVKISPFLAAAIISPPSNIYSAPGYVRAYLYFLMPIAFWLVALGIIKSIKTGGKELFKRLKIVLAALLGIFSLGYVNYNFKTVEYWTQIYFVFMGCAALAALQKRQTALFISSSTIALLGIATVRGKIELVPIIISFLFGFGNLALSLAQNLDLSKKWFKPLFSLSLALPAVLVSLLAFLKILPPALALMLFTIPFVTKPNEMLKSPDNGLVKDTAAAFLLFLFSGILFGTV